MTAAISDAAFRQQVRRWLREQLPADMVRRSQTAVHPSREDMLGVMAVLSRAGWSVPHWPAEHGGPGWSARQVFIFEEELMLAGGSGNNIQGVSLVGPVLCRFGTPAQQARYLPAIREGREFWAQGFSEPNAGSDLASLRTRAVRDGGVYLVNGQKIWTSQAMFADMLFCLVRTDPSAKPQRGISFLLIAMDSPGITVRPIPSLDEGESLCEVFLENVRVPVENLVGEEGKGWDCAKFLLGHERVQTAEVPRNKLLLARLKALAATEHRGAVALQDDPVFRHRLAQLEIDLIGLEAAVLDALDEEDGSAITPSALKVQGCELMQQMLGLQVEALGSHGAAVYSHSGDTLPGAATGPAHAPGVSAEFLFRRAATIYGGSNEVQKNIIAKLLFNGEALSRPAMGEDQVLLRESVSRFVQRTWPVEVRRPPAAVAPTEARQSWRRLADTGFAGLGLPEEAGGFGGAAELALACEAMGAGLADVPFVALAVRCGQLLNGLPAANRTDGADSADRTALPASVIQARPITAFAHDEAQQALDTVASTAQPDGRGYVLHGSKCLVLGGAAAERFVVSAQVAGEGLRLFLVDATAPGLHATLYRCLDGQGACDLLLDAVHVPASACLGDAANCQAAVDRANHWARVMASADAVGAMAQAIHITRDYLGTRRQFGTALSEFQALRHRMAEMVGELAIARALVHQAVLALDAPDTEGAARQRARLATACKARVGKAAMFVANQAVQLHGGIGMTDEYVIGRYYKRLFCFEQLMGNQTQQTRRFAGHFLIPA